MRYLVVTACAVAALRESAIASGNAVSSGPYDSQSAIEASPRVTVRETELHEFDWAKLQARARVAYVSSGPKTLTGRMIDGDPQTVFPFSASDPSPTVMVELAQSEPLHRVTAVFRAENTRVDVYLLNELPKDANDLRLLTPTATIVDPPQDRGSATLTFSASNARYVALRWTRMRSGDPLTVAEISAFSYDPTNPISDQEVHLAGPNFAVTGPPQVPVVSP